MITSISFRSMPQKQGFTLIELSIVLVIIGLLVGGILVGRDLIAAASIRSTLSQQANFDRATAAFRLKYNYLPGDLPNAASFGFDANGYMNQVNGDGNGAIRLTGSSTAFENISYWRHLQLAGMVLWNEVDPSNLGTVTGNYSPRTSLKANTPDAGYPGGWDVINAPEANDALVGLGTQADGSLAGIGHYFVIAAGRTGGDDNPAPGVLSPADAYAIDAKVDDGMPLSGTIKAWNGADNTSDSTPVKVLPGSPSIGASGNVCALSTTPVTYNFSNTDRSQSSLCTITLKAIF